MKFNFCLVSVRRVSGVAGKKKWKQKQIGDNKYARYEWHEKSVHIVYSLTVMLLEKFCVSVNLVLPFLTNKANSTAKTAQNKKDTVANVD